MNNKVHRVLSIILAVLIILNSVQFTIGSRVQAAGVDTFDAATGTLTLNNSFVAGKLRAQIDAVITPLGNTYADIKVLIVTAGIVGVGKIADGGSDIAAGGIIQSLSNLVDFQLIGTSSVQSSSSAPGDNIIAKNFFIQAQNPQLKSVAFQNATTINAQAFQNMSSISTVILPKVTTITSTNAFSGCTGITSITFGTTPPSLTSGNITTLYNSLAPGAAIYVPAASLTAYQSTWSAISSHISAIPSGGGTDPGSVGTFDAGTGTLTLTGAFAVSTLKTQIDAVIPSGKTYADIKVLKITSGMVGIDDTSSIIPLLTNLQDFQLTGTANTQSTANNSDVGIVQANFFTAANAQLTSVTLQNATTINAQAFQNCSKLLTLIVPSLTTVVDATAFTGTTHLASITLGAAVPTSGPTSFPASAIFLVPGDKVAIYQADAIWSSVAPRIKAIGDSSGGEVVDPPVTDGPAVITLKPTHPNIVSVDESARSIQVIEKTSLEQLDAQTTNGASTILRVLDAKGIPKNEITELVAGDKFVVITGGTKKEYTIEVVHYTLENLALNPNASSIKVSSFRSGNDPTNAFNGASTGNAGSGYQVDGSQSTSANISAGKNTFWLALDLGQMKKIDQFSVAWGTTVGDLTTRLANSTYRVEYTNDPAKWAALSNATVAGSGGIATGYSKPSGWDVAYAQDVTQLPDANGNKVFMSNLASPINARYVMVTGELASNWIEIYNFYVFQKEVSNVAPVQPVYPTADLAKIMPDYEGMSLTIGRPAIVKKDTAVPKFDITSKADITVSGVLKDPSGNIVYTLSSQNMASGATSVITPNVKASKLGTYIFEFTIAGSKTIYDKVYFTAVDEDITQYSYTKPYPAFSVIGGKLVYVPDYRGNTVMDYSNAGYKGGGVEIPNVPVKLILEPSQDSNSDDTERIQNAINMLGRIDPDSNGFRGSILLKAGTYRVSSSIKIAASGIVIKGEGDDHEGIETHSTPLSPTNWKDYTHSEAPQPNVTKVVATWIASSYDKNTAVFNFAGSATSTSGSAIKVVDQYVPAGGHTIRLESVSGLSVGDTVNIRKAVNAAWAQDLRMDVITDAPGIPSANQWAANGVVDSSYVTTDEERTIQSINPVTNEIMLIEPLADVLDMRYGVSTVTKYNPTGRINNVGIENMLIMSRFDSSTTAINTAFGVSYQSFDDELHAELAIRFGNAQNAWARTITTYHIDSAVAIATGVSKITIQDVNCLEPVSGTGGERRYNFSNAGGTLVLNQRNYSRYTRHGFIVMGNVVGQNVFYNDRTDYQFDANEPHLRWSTGGLYDNINGRIYLQDRWNNGTAHGWSGANYTLYNNTGPYIISQNQIAANYLFGQTGERLPFVMDAVDPGNVPNFRAYEYSNGSKMTPASLFIQQLKDRMGQAAVDATNNSVIPAYIDQSGDFASQFATLTGIFVDGVPIPNFNNEVLSYTVPVPLDYTALPVITYTAGTGVTVSTSIGGNSAVILTATMPGKKDSVYTVNYGIINKSVPVTSSAGGSNVNNLVDGLLSTSWSASGTPWVQFYLGDKPAFINSVSLGYSRDTQIRRSYYFEFQVSNDGYTWTKVMANNWQQDNLGNGHIMGKEVLPGPDGDSAADYETFTFPADISGRLLRVAMFGARSGTGTGTSNSNKYWAIDVGAAISGGPLAVSKQPQNAAKRTGFTASYTVTMSGGTRPYNYQWQMSKDAGATWNNVTSGTGVNTATYTTGAITADMDGLLFRSKITDADSSNPQTAYSNAASLTVKQDTGIIVTPVGTSVSVFDNVIYSRTATIRNTTFVYGLLGYLDIKPVGSTVFIIPSNISPKTESVAAFTDAMAAFWPPDDDSLRDTKKSYIRKSGEQIRDGDHLLIINPAGTGVERYIINYAKMDDATMVSADKSVITFDKIKGQNTSPDGIIGNLSLPTTSSYGSSISWKVDNNSYLSAAGVVKRPLFAAGDARVTLTATITSGTVTDTVIFNLTILKKSAEELPSNSATVTAKGSTETGYLWGLAVDNAGKTITGLAASTSVDAFKNGLILAPAASWKVVTSAVGSTVTADTFASAVETTKNVANGNLLIVLAEDGVTLNKYTITLKPTAPTPSAAAVPGKKYNTTKLTGLVAGTAYEYVIRTVVGMPSASTWASSSVQFTTGAGETEKDNLFVTQGTYLYIRAAETGTMSSSSPMYILIDISQINKTVDASAPTATLQPGSNHLTTKLTGLLPGTAYEYIVNTSAQELVNWDAALLFTTASSETTKDNIPALSGQYLHIRFSAIDNKEASSEKNIYITADLVKVKPANATPQSSAQPGTLGGTTKLTGLLPNTTYLYIINTNTDNPATDAWDHKGRSITTGNGQTVYDNIVSSPELYMHLMVVETSSNANSLPQNYLVGAGGVRSLPQGIVPTASAEPGTAGSTMKLTGLLPETAYEFVVTDALSSPKNTTWGEGIVIRSKTGAGETTIDNIEIPADLGNMHVRTGGTTINSPSEAQNFIILGSYVNNASGTLSNNAYVTAATSGPGYIPGLIVSGKAPNFTIRNVPAGTTKEALKAALLKNSKAGWKVVANAAVSATVKDTATFNSAREISTNVSIDNVLTVLAEDGKTVQRYTITNNVTTVSLTGIAVKTLPAKTSYIVGDALDLTGLEIEAAYSDGTKASVSGYAVSPAGGTSLNATGTTTVSITYTEDGVSKTASFNVTVGEATRVTNVTLTGTSSIGAGQTFDLNFGLTGVTQAIYAQDLTLMFDPAQLELISIDPLVKDQFSVVASEKAPGQVRILLASLGQNHAVNADGDLLRLRFKAKSIAQSVTGTVALMNVTLANGNGMETPVSGASHNVQITVIPRVPGDLNSDGKVSIGDLAIVAAWYGKTSADPNWEQYKAADMNGDGKIDIVDLAAVANKILQN
ncbi:immunoglobulin-like domain-containing protein [Paenibacillus planticolens]|uniref:Leucine-rich repeat protein n=1 Tax=Paenibacillus planticolens TaxID=2654976 RepID=A0ABX1ZUG5_9BACL|nr:immunoglobulin-like domain-containing protein [Paenibacillus planticolens]NOV03691.1 leucine-rich repeat protein [Paenibacillus planticolens]